MVFDAPVPGHCLLVTLKIETEMSKYIDCTKLSSLQKASSDGNLPIIHFHVFCTSQMSQ